LSDALRRNGVELMLGVRVVAARKDGDDYVLEGVPKVYAPEGPICHQRGGRDNYADIHSKHTGATQ
jgi:hypothetical protein